MKLNQTLAIAAFSIALISSSFATVPTTSASSNNIKPADFDQCSQAYKEKCDKFVKWKKDNEKNLNNSAVKNELKRQLADLKKDAYQLKKLVANTFKLILQGKLQVTDPGFITRCNAFVAQVNDINTEIAAIEAAIAMGNTGNAQQKLDKIVGKLTGVVVAGNLLFGKNVSLPT